MRPWRPFLARNALGLVGLAILAAAVAGALAAPYIAPYSPTSISLLARMKPPAWIGGGSITHPLGTDNLGRDILSRVIYGSRISLAVGFAAVLLGALIGSTVGILAGYFGGWVDSGLSFLIDVQLSFPFTLLAIFLLATLGGGFCLGGACGHAGFQVLIQLLQLPAGLHLPRHRPRWRPG